MQQKIQPKRNKNSYPKHYTSNPFITKEKLRGETRIKLTHKRETFSASREEEMTAKISPKLGEPMS